MICFTLIPLTVKIVFKHFLFGCTMPREIIACYSFNVTTSQTQKNNTRSDRDGIKVFGNWYNENEWWRQIEKSGHVLAILCRIFKLVH